MSPWWHQVNTCWCYACSRFNLLPTLHLDDDIELPQQDGWKAQDGRMTKKYHARLCILARHFFVILPSGVFQPSCCVSSLLLEREKGKRRPINLKAKRFRALWYFSTSMVRPLIVLITECSHMIGWHMTWHMIWPVRIRILVIGQATSP